MIDKIDGATIVEDPSPTSPETELDTRYGKCTERYQLRFHKLDLQHTSDLHHMVMT